MIARHPARYYTIWGAKKGLLEVTTVHYNTYSRVAAWLTC
jgi:hypothetical protein